MLEVAGTILACCLGYAAPDISSITARAMLAETIVIAILCRSERLQSDF